MVDTVFSYLSWWHVPALICWIGSLYNFTKVSPWISFPWLYDSERDYETLVKYTRRAMWFLVVCEISLVLAH